MRRPEARAARPALSALLALLALLALAPAGCARPGPQTAPELPRDTGPTAAGIAVLGRYSEPVSAPRAAAGPRPGRLQDTVIDLPGEPDRPWDGPPRTLGYPERPGQASAGAQVPARVVLRAGDRIRVSVAGHPEFSGEWKLGADGRAAIPAGGAFGVGGFTGESFSAELGALSGREPAQAGRTIASRLRRFVRGGPRVTVEVLPGEGL